MAEEKKLGLKIRQIRTLQNVSIENLSSKTNLSVAQIEKIENEGVVPSLAPLLKIARALGVRLGTFLDDNDHLGPVITRAAEKNQGVRFSANETGSREHLNFFSLAADKYGRSMEPFVVEIEPGKQSDYRLSTHEGEEFIYVLDGSIEINYGKDVFVLEAGDSIYLDSIVMHNVHAATSNIARVLVVLYMPF